MMGVVFPGDRKVEVREFDIPEPQPGEVLIKVKASAICRSDMHLYYGVNVLGGEVPKECFIPGHEPAGQVEKTGPNVRTLKQGDRVAVYLANGCGNCEYCKAGYIMLCSEFKCIGFDMHGGDAEYMIVPEKYCMKIPQDMSYVTAALSTDAIGTLYHAQKRMNISGRDTMALFGIGPMGGAGVMVAKGMGATTIAVDNVADRLALAKELGADYTIDFSKVDAVAAIKEITCGRGADAAIDTSGNSVAENNVLDCLKPHGRAAFVGEATQTTIKPSEQFIRKQIMLFGSWYFPIWEYEEIVDFIMERKLPVEKLVTHRFSLKDADEAFKLFDTHKTQKVVFV